MACSWLSWKYSAPFGWPATFSWPLMSLRTRPKTSAWRWLLIACFFSVKNHNVLGPHVFPSFLFTKTLLFGEMWATKNIAKKPRKCSLRRATNVVFSKFRGWRRKNENRAPHSFLKLRFAREMNRWINELIRVNSGPNILRICFLHWCFGQALPGFFITAHHLCVFLLFLEG